MVEFVDDIDGTPAQQTITFALDGVTYEIDLSDRHAKQLRSVLERHIEHARTVPAPGEKKAPAVRAKQQARRSNKDLTEQIRGAAQRTREYLNKKVAAEQAMRIDQEPVEEVETMLVEPPTTDRPERTASAPELLPPQFLSA